MERRKALAVAAATAMLGASAVVASRASFLRGTDAAAVAPSTTTTSVGVTTIGPAPTLAPLDPVVVTEVRDVYDTVVVPTTPPLAAAGVPVETTPVAVPATPRAATPAPSPTTAPAPIRSSGPSPTTTAPPTTSTTRPPEVPEDWPPDRPVPPMPEGCEEPHLEDDGVWNCDH